jgi:predicted DNA-binding mobile mystery protein A
MKAALQRVLLSTLDSQAPTLIATQKSISQPATGWLRAARQALGLSQAAVAKKAGVTQQAYAQFERGEASGTLSLRNLQRAAEAMDCELVHYLVPRTGRAKSFSELARQLDPDFVHLQASEHSMALEGQAVGDLPSKAEGASPAGP